jgi:cephalosporin hydroxylase
MRELTDERQSRLDEAGVITTVCSATRFHGRSAKKESRQMQNVNTLIRRPVPIGSAAAGGLLAFVAGAAIALGAPAIVVGLSASHSSNNATVSVSAVGGEQIAHNRSEQGLDVSRSVGAEQIAHDRSEGVPGR